MRLRRILVVVCLLALQVGRAGGEPMTFQSAATQVPLIELYTSEGCSSCPPADRWLSGLTSDARLWQQFVPVAFHVDYWDYIGWKDRFAAPEYGQRQAQYARSGGISQVYTPGLVAQGREWRGWFRNPDLDVQTGDEVGRLQIDLVDGDRGAVSFEPRAKVPEDLTVNVALLGFDLVSEIQRGENTGKTLHHDFVVLGMTQTPLRREGDRYVADVTLPSTRQQASRLGLAAWVSAGANPAPLQTVGGWLTAR